MFSRPRVPEGMAQHTGLKRKTYQGERPNIPISREASNDYGPLFAQRLKLKLKLKWCAAYRPPPRGSRTACPHAMRRCGPSPPHPPPKLGPSLISIPLSIAWHACFWSCMPWARMRVRSGAPRPCMRVRSGTECPPTPCDVGAGPVQGTPPATTHGIWACGPGPAQGAPPPKRRGDISAEFHWIW